MIPILAILVIIVFGFGILASRLGETCLNAENSYHLDLKPIWDNNKYMGDMLPPVKGEFNHCINHKKNGWLCCL